MLNDKVAQAPDGRRPGDDHRGWLPVLERWAHPAAGSLRRCRGQRGRTLPAAWGGERSQPDESVWRYAGCSGARHTGRRPHDQVRHVDQRPVAEPLVDSVGGRVGLVREQAHPGSAVEDQPGERGDGRARVAVAAFAAAGCTPARSARSRSSAGRRRSDAPAARSVDPQPDPLASIRRIILPGPESRALDPRGRPAFSSASAMNASNQPKATSMSSGWPGAASPRTGAGSITRASSNSRDALLPPPLAPKARGLLGAHPAPREEHR